MQVDFVTKEDLAGLEKRLNEKIERLLYNSRGIGSMPDYLSQKQAMEFLSISDQGLMNLRKDGQLPYTKVGHRVFYAYKDVVKLMERNKRIR